MIVTDSKVISYWLNNLDNLTLNNDLTMRNIIGNFHGFEYKFKNHKKNPFDEEIPLISISVCPETNF